MNAEDELKQLARAGKRMRQLQRHADRTRTPDALAASKRAEREFDELVETILGGRTPELPWDQPPEAGQ